METQRNELINLVERNGWKATELDNYDYHKWSAESWLLESVWSPVGVKAYVYFELDPLYPPQKSHAWAILVSDDTPQAPVFESYDEMLTYESPGTNLSIPLKHWKNEKQNLIKFLDQIRTETPTN